MEVTVPNGSTVHWLTSSGEVHRGVFDSSAEWFGIDTSTPEGAQRYNELFTKRYGGVPMPPNVIGHPPLGTELNHVELEELVKYAYSKGWRPFNGTTIGTGAFNGQDLYDLAFTLDELSQGVSSSWYIDWKNSLSAEPGRQTPNVPARKFPVGSFEELTSTKHWGRTSYWSYPAAVGREQELFDMVVEQVRQDPTPDAVTLEHGPVSFQPSLVLALVDHLKWITAAPPVTLPGAPVAAPPETPALDLTLLGALLESKASAIVEASRGEIDSAIVELRKASPLLAKLEIGDLDTLKDKIAAIVLKHTVEELRKM